MSRRVWTVLVLVVSLGLVAFGVWSGRTPHQINREGCERISVGMTEEEVECVLGKPAGYYAKGEVISAFSSSTHWSQTKDWISNDGEIAVTFDEGKVVSASYNDVYDLEGSLLDKFRRWMGL